MSRRSPASAEVLQFVRDFYSAHGALPTFRGIGQGLGMGMGTAKQRVQTLKEEGFLRSVTDKDGRLALGPRFFEGDQPGSANITSITSASDKRSRKDGSHLELAGVAAIDPERKHRPLAAANVRLGFPSPAEDFSADALDLNELLITNEPATFFYRARGHSMEGDGIFDGDILVVDRSIKPEHGDLVVAIWDGNAAACKRLRFTKAGIELHSSSPGIEPIHIPEGVVVEAFVVTGVTRQIKRAGKHGRPK